MHRLKRGRRPARGAFACLFAVILLVLGPRLAAPSTARLEPSASAEELSPILNYISRGWDTLTRSMTECNTVVDPKIREASVLYVPAHFPVPATLRDVRQRCNVEVRELPVSITSPG